MGKIVSIKKKVPQETKLPDGIYFGKWGGSIIEINYNKETYELKTQEGVRGFDISVCVTIKDGEATFDDTVRN